MERPTRGLVGLGVRVGATGKEGWNRFLNWEGESGELTLDHAVGVFSCVDPAGFDGGWEERGRVGGLGNVVWMVFFEKEEGSRTRCH